MTKITCRMYFFLYIHFASCIFFLCLIPVQIHLKERFIILVFASRAFSRFSVSETIAAYSIIWTIKPSKTAHFTALIKQIKRKKCLVMQKSSRISAQHPTTFN